MRRKNKLIDKKLQIHRGSESDNQSGYQMKGGSTPQSFTTDKAVNYKLTSYQKGL
jgi:hypothetical protein